MFQGVRPVDFATKGSKDIGVKLGTRVFRRRERYVNLILGIVRAYAASTVGNTGRRGDFGSWEVEG